LTLIAGVKLPRGILFVSDTRETKEDTGEVVSDWKRKIILIYPGCFLASSGQASTDHIANILRNCLYNSSIDKNALSRLGTDRHRIISDLYDNVNNLHMMTHKYNEPIGHILIAELEEGTAKLNLFEAGGYTGFRNFNEIERTELIGSTQTIRSMARAKIENLLNLTTEEKLNDEFIFVPLAKDIQKILQEETRDDLSVGESMYCTYITQRNGKPASCVFFLDPNGEFKQMDEKDNSEFFTVPE